MAKAVYGCGWYDKWDQEKSDREDALRDNARQSSVASSVFALTSEIAVDIMNKKQAPPPLNPGVSKKTVRRRRIASTGQQALF